MGKFYEFACCFMFFIKFTVLSILWFKFCTYTIAINKQRKKYLERFTRFSNFHNRSSTIHDLFIHEISVSLEKGRFLD